VGCPKDCYCGNKTCEPQFGETQNNCAKDCGEPCNNNGVCDLGETLTGCPKDCTCGNGKCDNPYDFINTCGEECKSLCGNGKCDCLADYILGCFQQDCPVSGACQ
jgi:hypothetical protein